MGYYKQSPVLVNDLCIRIVGAGIGGLSCALSLARAGFTNIHVYERASSLGEVGAGINIVPNLARLLERWGVLDVARREGVALKKSSVLQCGTDEVLTSVDFGYMLSDFGYPFLVVHRSALQKALLTGVEASGVVKIHLQTVVTEYDFDNSCCFVKRRNLDSNRATNLDSASSAFDEKGEWVHGDVILVADGVKSKCRERLLARKGEKDHVKDTGQAAYRILVKKDSINNDPELLPFFEGSQSYRWIGERRHIIAYPINKGTIFNMSTAHPDRKFVEADTWTASGSKSEMLEVFQDFCPRVQKLLALVPEGEVLEWKLRVHDPLSHWVDNNVALLGDACHSTLPHLAQGAAQAVEDAAVLGVVLSRITSKADVSKALKVYQALRKPRADWQVQTAAANGKGLHLAQGKDQAARDEAFRAAQSTGGSNPDKQIDKEVQTKLYTHDCMAYAAERFADLFAQM